MNGKAVIVKKMDSLVEVWRNLPRSNDKEREEAERFYEEKILPLSLGLFAERHAHLTGFYDYLIISLGTSWASLAHCIRAIRPKEVLVLCSEMTRKDIDKVIEWGNLRPSQVMMAIIDETEPLDIYREVKKVWERWGRTRRLAIDFTGGTKAMSVGCALVGSLLEVDLLYVANDDYLKDLRRPRPGSERIVKISNPLQVFGDIEAQRGFDLMQEYDYRGAGRVFEKLCRSVPEPRKFEVLKLLCQAYHAWDNLDIKNAFAFMRETLERIDQYSRGDGRFELLAYREFLKVQDEILKKMADKMASKESSRGTLGVFADFEFVMALMLTIYANARRRESQGKYDTAALMMYRLLEMISQARLASYGIDTADANYEGLPIDQGELYAKYLEGCKRYGLHESLSLPRKIPLVVGYLILSILGDPLMEGVNLKRVSEQSNIRNSTIFAHGFSFISENTYRRFRELVENLLVKFFEINGRNFADEAAKYEFVKIG